MRFRFYDTCQKCQRLTNLGSDRCRFCVEPRKTARVPRGPYKKRSEADYSWSATVREMFHRGDSVPIMLAACGVSETQLWALAHRWGWDVEGRKATVRALRRGGRTIAEHTRLRQRAKKIARKAVGDVPVDLVAVIRADSPVCPYCAAPLSPDTVTVDHIDPVARGGTNDPENLVGCCARCNAGKCDHPLAVWLARRAHRRAA